MSTLLRALALGLHARIGVLLLVAIALGGCAALSSTTPVNREGSCQAVGGTYSGGQCQRGGA
jgi:hypothetical protein